MTQETAVPYGRDEVETVRRLADEGLVDREIGEHLGISANRVKHIRARHGIKSPWMAIRGSKSHIPNVLHPAELEWLRRQVGFREGFDYGRDDRRHNEKCEPSS